MKKTAIVSNIRPDTKMNSAMTIFLSIPASADKRQSCLAQFQKQLDMKYRTASTYYQLCIEKLLTLQEPVTEQAIESNKARKFSSVKTTRGSSVAAHVAVFLSKADAEAFNEKIPGFQTVSGIVHTGDTIAAA